MRVYDLHDHSDAGNEVCGLLPELGVFVIEAPFDDTADLGQVGLGAHLQAVDHCAEPVEHDISVVGHLQTEQPCLWHVAHGEGCVEAGVLWT